nr:hypothetical protein [Tanacetum cinerariifolium]
MLALRKPHVLVQFWSPRVVGKHHQLTTKDQPFGLGVNDDRLLFYRRDSESKFYVVDKDYDEEEDISPLVRVFRQGLPEWSLDVTKYLPNHFPQQECAISCNLQGYMALPVLDPTTRLPIGVIELLMSSSIYTITSFYYEVQQIQKALKEQDLTCLRVSGGPVPNNELNRIFDLLKVMCDTHRLPLAQTWALSPFSTVLCTRHGLVAFSGCMHLDMSRGLVGKALSYRGSCFCEDVTKLSEEEYPLVSHAGMSGLTSCFAIYLPSVGTNDGYVLEFFLPLRIDQDSIYMMKQQVIKIASGFGLDDNSPIQVIGPLINPSVTNSPYVMQTSPVNVSDECSSTNVSVTFNDAGETSSYLKRGRKRKRGSDDTMVLVTVTFGEDNKSFRFPISLGLLKLKKEVAKRFKLSKMIRLKYTDEDNDLILICVDKDLEDAMVASGICKTQTFALRDKPHSFFTPEGKPPRQGLNPRPLACVSLPFCVQDMGLWPFRDACKAQHLDMSRGLVGKALSYRGSCFCEDVTKRSEEEYPLVSHAGMSGLTSCFAIYLPSVGTNDGYVLEFFLPLRIDQDNECSSTNVSVTFNDAGETSSYLKRGRKRKRGSDDTMELVTVTFGEDNKSFRFPISLGLLKLKKEVAKRFKLSKTIRLKYTDEDNDLILICVDKDLEDAMVASGSKNNMNLICLKKRNDEMLMAVGVTFGLEFRVIESSRGLILLGVAF